MIARIWIPFSSNIDAKRSLPEKLAATFEGPMLTEIQIRKALKMQENKMAELLLERVGKWGSPAAIKDRESGLAHGARA